MKPLELKIIIVDQREEMEEKFQKENIIPGEVDFTQFKKYIHIPNLLAILGIRRCGKSILMCQGIEGGLGTKDYGQWTIDYGLWTRDRGRGV